jgi:cysteinyl-tRNA synthetase
LGTGLVYSSGGTLTSTNPSDERLKDNITDISWGLNDILKLRPVSYHWKDDKINQGVQFGFIAQEVQDVMPEAIKEFGEDVKYLGLEKDAIYATLVKAIQELKAEIDELKAK